MIQMILKNIKSENAGMEKFSGNFLMA